MASRLSHRTIGFAATAGLALVLSPSLSEAGDTGPVIVMPGAPGVPVMMNGRDISWAVVEGDWGLARPSLTAPTVIYRLGPGALIGPAPGAYYPATGRRPAYGRLEVVPPANRPLPPPAEGYFREWGVSSGDAPASAPSAEPPAVMYAPQAERRRRPRPQP